MSFNYRQSGSWSTPTVKKREGGQWVTVGTGSDGGGGDSDIPARFYTTEPSRGAGTGPDGAAVVYPDDGHSSLQAAYDALSSGERLWIDPASGPYSGDYIRYNTSNTTIDGYDPDTDSRARLEITSASDLVIEASDDTPSYASGTSLATTYPAGSGATEIQVSDASVVSVGDVVHISENGYTFDAGSSHSITRELHIVEDTDTSSSPNTITIDHELMLPYPGNSSTEVGTVTFDYEDIRFHGLHVVGMNNTGGTDVYPFSVKNTRKAWIDNCEGERSDDGYIISVSESFESRCDDIYVHDSSGGGYGLVGYRDCHRGYWTNIDGENLSRYTIRFGSNSDRPCTDFLVDGVTATDHSGPGMKCHGGSHFVTLNNLNVNASVVEGTITRLSSQYNEIDGFTASSTEGGWLIYIEWGPDPVVIRNSLEPVTGYGGLISFRLDGTSYLERGDITLEDIDMEATGGNSAGDIGEFRWDSNDENYIESLTIHNVTYDGSYITQSDVEQWDDYDASKINDLSVTNDG